MAIVLQDILAYRVLMEQVDTLAFRDTAVSPDTQEHQAFLAIQESAEIVLQVTAEHRVSMAQQEIQVTQAFRDIAVSLVIQAQVGNQDILE